MSTPVKNPKFRVLILDMIRTPRGAAIKLPSKIAPTAAQ